MDLTTDLNDIIAIGAAITAILSVVGGLWRGFSFINQLKEEIKELKRDIADNHQRDVEYREQAEKNYEVKLQHEVEKLNMNLKHHQEKDNDLSLKIDRNKETSNERFDKLEKKIDDGFEKLEKRIANRGIMRE